MRIYMYAQVIMVDVCDLKWQFIYHMEITQYTVQPACNLHLNTRHRDLPQRVC